MSDIGILAQGSHVIGENNVVIDCGRYSVVLNIGESMISNTVLLPIIESTPKKYCLHPLK